MPSTVNSRFPIAGRRLAACTLVAGLLGAGAVSSAQAATITACQKKSNGALRVIKAGKACKRTEVRVTFKDGAAGPAGSAGAPGAAGAIGAAGIAGAKGDKGDRGPGAVRFSGSTGSFGLAETKTVIETFTVGGVNVRFTCGNVLVANAAAVEVTAPTSGSLDTAATYAENPDASIDVPQAVFASSDLAANIKSTQTIALAGGDATANRSVFSSVIEAGGKVITLTGAANLPAGGAGCSIRGTAIIGE